MSSDLKTFTNDLDLLSNLFSNEASHGSEVSQFTFPYLFDSFMPATEENLGHPDVPSHQNEPLKPLEATKKSVGAITDAYELQRNINLTLGDVESLSGDQTSSQDDDETSNLGSDPENLRKRGKYRTYSEEEKAHIINFATKYGIDKTLELFSAYDHKITKRKLKGWLDGLNKTKGVKGRKSSDPVRDQALYKWCEDFKKKHDRYPSRKEATRKALDVNGDPNFQASKGWLDKFSRKFKIEFTPFKVIPPKPSKKVKIAEFDTNSATSTVDSATLENTPPAVSFRQDVQPEKPAFINFQEKPQTIHTSGIMDFSNQNLSLKQLQHELKMPQELFGNHFNDAGLPYMGSGLFEDMPNTNNQQAKRSPYPIYLPGNSQLPATFDLYKPNPNRFRYLNFEKTVDISYQP